jgi:hypothetical protein
MISGVSVSGRLDRGYPSVGFLRGVLCKNRNRRGIRHPKPGNWRDTSIILSSRSDASEEDIVRLCREAVDHGFHSVCVNSCWSQRCAELLRGTGVSVCSVVGFPLGPWLLRPRRSKPGSQSRPERGKSTWVINIRRAVSRAALRTCVRISAVSGSLRERRSS